MSHAKLICTLLAASTLAFGGVAHAAPMIRLTSGASSLTLSSHSPSARAAEAAAGWTVGAWLVDMTSSRSAPRLDLLSGQFVSNAAGTYLDVELSDTDFSLAGAGALARFFGSIAGTTTGTATWWMYIDDANAQFGRSTLIGSGSTMDLGSFAGAFSDAAGVDGSFSMTLLVRINHGNGANRTDFDFGGFATVAAIPEPGTVLLIGVGLLAIVLMRRRKRD